MDTSVFEQGVEHKRIADATERLAERQRSDLRKVLQMPEGRRVIWRFISAGAPLTSPYAGAGAESLTFLNIGKREFSILIYAEIKATQPEFLLAMERESASDKLLREAEFKGDSNGR